MGEANTTLLSKLIALSKVDASLARILAESKQLESNLADKLLSLKKRKEEFAQRSSTLAERRERIRREEKRLKDEQQKLIDRRKGLATFTNYKLQQAAEKEIEHAAKQLGVYEEQLLVAIDEMESLEAEVEQAESELNQFETEVNELAGNSDATLQSLHERRQEKEAERAELARDIDPAQLAVYDRIMQRYPMDPVVPLSSDHHCQGCYMQVGPQMIVQVARGEELVKCRGCGRILYLTQPEEKSE